MGNTTPASGPDPRVEYTGRLADRQARQALLERRHVLVSNLRLVLFGLFLLLLWLVFGSKSLHFGSLAVPVAAFLGLVVYHDVVIKAQDRARRSIHFYEYAIARLENRWMGKGRAGEGFHDPDHPYEADLDLFGKGSLFELLSQARTGAGEARLAEWLLSPSGVAEIRERQEAISELKGRLDLREDLALLGAEMEVGVDPEKLLEWSRSPHHLASQPLRWTALLLTLLSIVTAIGWASWGFGAGPFFLVVFAQIVYRMILRRRFNEVAGGVSDAATDLSLLASVLRTIEGKRFESARLQRISRSLRGAGSLPSIWTRRLVRLVDCLEARKNSLFAPISFALLWEYHFAFAIEAWRARVGKVIPEWLDAVAEFESLGSLAGYAYERPDHPFPEIVQDETLFDAEQIGHPLLPEEGCVRNDLRLDSDRRLLVVSGSNMSGKSTLLRTVGISIVLALAGAPVRARRLRLSPFSVGASIRIQDSMLSGVSRFYAEIRRLRQIVGLLGADRPVCFLIDEILQGTNSHDRKIGVEAVMTSMVEKGAVGLITTHDLALTAIVEAIGARADNVHFEDQLEGGTMRFDYRLRPGIVQRSNALGLMRAVGLEV